MNTLVTFLLVSIIPLLVFIYLKLWEGRKINIKKDIIKSLSYMIGEGKPLDEFEFSIVFNSKTREGRTAKNVFTEVSILEDLATEIIMNPLIEKDRKNDIIINLQNLIYRKLRDDIETEIPSTIFLSSTYGAVGAIIALILSVIMPILLGIQSSTAINNDELLFSAVASIIAFPVSSIITKYLRSYERKKYINKYRDSLKE